ncbi:MAG TPA: VUT family protein, partial [Chitinophagales bacterium]|nr:VUT family protein [Chitinophagales bacterium]
VAPFGEFWVFGDQAIANCTHWCTLIDSFIVLFVAFYLLKRGQPGQWSFNMVLAVGVVNYIYKVGAAFLLTPVIYLAHKGIDNYLGLETATKLRKEAVEGKLE